VTTFYIKEFKSNDLLEYILLSLAYLVTKCVKLFFLITLMPLVYVIAFCMRQIWRAGDKLVTLLVGQPENNLSDI
jgi:hypothetical protein